MTHVLDLPAQLRQQSSFGDMKQVKVSVSAEVASAFKKACMDTGVSMACKLSQYMAEYSNIALANTVVRPDYSTKRRRRAAIRKVIRVLEHIKISEEQYRDNIPENLQGAPCYERSEEFIANLESAIDSLVDIELI